MWRFILLLALSHGAFCIAPGAYWVRETLKCSELRVVVEPNRNLVELPEEFDRMCKRQDNFYRCLETMFSIEYQTDVAELPSEIEKERTIFNGLCSEDSIWRLRYLEFAPCINMQETDFCNTPEFLGADGGDQNYCTIYEKVTNCIAATLSMKCSIEAGHLFHYLLKLSGNEDCQLDTTCHDSESRCEENNSRRSVIVQLIDQLSKEVDPTPDQDLTENLVLRKGVGDLQLELPDVEDDSSSSSEIEDLDYASESVSEDVEHDFSQDYDTVSEAISSFLDALDEI